jgi:hypothetical protein
MAKMDKPDYGTMLVTFYQRLAKIDSLLRIIIRQYPLNAHLKFRGDPDRSILLDYGKVPAEILVDDKTRQGQVRVAIDQLQMHRVHTGEVPAGLAFGRRDLLLRGSPANLAYLIPLIDFAPLLYREHMADIGFGIYRRKTDNAPLKEIVMKENQFKGDPIPLHNYSDAEKFIFSIIKGLAYAVGYAVGAIRYRLFENLNLFEVLESMANGVKSATPDYLLNPSAGKKKTQSSVEAREG